MRYVLDCAVVLGSMMSDKLIIFDTTLRDGEQSPGASMTRDEKVLIAKGLERLGVDVIEAGFPVASQGDFESVQAVANTIENSTVCALARALTRDIDRAADALKDAPRRRIHTFLATSPIHMKMKLRMEPDQVLEQAVHAVKRARQYTDDVEFSAEDAGRSELDFLCRVVEAAIDAGASTINIPDTVGYNIPHQFGETMRQIIERVPNSDKAIFSVPHSESEYLALVKTLDNLIDEVGNDQNHDLAPVMETIGNLIENYENQICKVNESSPIDALKYLMQEYDLKQTDLTEIGSQGVVSEVLTGKRALNIDQIKKISKRFHVSPLVFM